MRRVKGLLFLLPQLIFAQENWRGIPYPMNRWGVSIMGVKQTEKGDLIEASVTGKLTEGFNINIDFLQPEDLRVDADVQIIKVDYFVLPFLNLYAIGGKLEATAKFNLGKANVKFDSTGNPILDGILEGVAENIAKHIPKSIEHKSEGNLYGAGALIAGEYNRVFSSFQYTYTRIEMDGDVAAKSAEVAAARLGYVAYRSEKISITPYVGVAYQKTDSTISGAIPGVQGINYKFQMELEESTPSIGFFTNISDSFTVFVDYSFGDRETLAIDLGYRF